MDQYQSPHRPGSESAHPARQPSLRKQQYLRPRLESVSQGAVIKKVRSVQDMRQEQPPLPPTRRQMSDHFVPGTTAAVPTFLATNAERVQSPAPSTTTLSSLRKPLSRLFGRRKSRPSIYGSPVDMPTIPATVAGETFPPIPEASPPLSMFEDDRPTPSRSPTKSKTLPRASKIPLMSTDSPRKDSTPKAPKAKRSFSALAALFKAGNSSSPTKPSPPRAISPVKKVISAPILATMDFEPRSPSSMAQLFDSAHADVENMLEGGKDNALSYSLGPSSRMSLAIPSNAPALSKARSTPDLYGHARKFSTAASLRIVPPSPNAQRDPVPSVPNSPVTTSRIPSPTFAPVSAMSSLFPVSPSPTSVTFSPNQSPSRINRSRSPTLPSLGFPNATGGLPSLLEAISDETEKPSEQLGSSSSTALPYLATPTPPSPEKLPLSARIVKDKELRPNTAGTFGRPHTGVSIRPDTGNSYRPDTGASLRPDTATSLSDFTIKTAAKQRLDGRTRFRRISGLSSGLSDDAAENSDKSEYSDEEEERISSKETERKAAHQSAANVEAAQEQSEGMTRDDSGFADNGAVEYTKYSTTLVSPSALSLFANAKKTNMRPMTADTIPFPANLPDIDASFNPKGSLGSIAQQSSVSILSDFERSIDERMSNWISEEESEKDGKDVKKETEQPKSSAPASTSFPPSPERPPLLRPGDQLFGSIVGKKVAEMGIDNKTRTWAESSVSSKSTPVKRKTLLQGQENTPSPIITKRFGTEEEAAQVMKNSVSSSVMSRILARRHLEDSIFLKHTLTFSRAFAGDGVSSVQTRDVATQTGPDLPEQPVVNVEPFTPAAPTRTAPATAGLAAQYSSSTAAMSSLNRLLNNQIDPFAQSYFPPMHTLAKSGMPMLSPVSTRGGLGGSPMSGFSESEKDRIIEQLKEALEKEMQRREMLEYALAAQKSG